MRARRRCWLGLLVAVGALMSAGAANAATSTPRYRLTDLGTLGGPNSAPNDPGISIAPNGAVVGSSDTPALNPFAGIAGYPMVGCLGEPCHANHAFEWRNGLMTDLGTLGGYNAGLFELNGAGNGAGFSETGRLDPLTGFPEAHAAMSNGGRLIDLGTLGGNESFASGINDRGQVSGVASNSTPDPLAASFGGPYPSATQWRAVIWQDGRAHNLGTLGGPDSAGGFLDARGDVAGDSFTNSTPNPTTRIPTVHPFLWRNGVMHDLGSLGGTLGFTTWMNNHSQVVGVASLAGDNAFHPFLWDGHRLVDLGTLGGDFGFATWVNNRGAVVGQADLPGGQASHAFLWSHGAMQDLPPTGGDTCSVANAINARGQAVGADTVCGGPNLNAMLWANGSSFNLNLLIAPSPLHLNEAFFISASGEIACLGTLPNGDMRVAVLTPVASASDRFAPTSAAPPIHTHELTPARTVPDRRDLFTTVRDRIALLSTSGSASRPTIQASSRH